MGKLETHLSKINNGDGNSQRNTSQRTHTWGFWKDETDGYGYVRVEVIGGDGGMIE